jgi:uncharacterized membrane protein
VIVLIGLSINTHGWNDARNIGVIAHPALRDLEPSTHIEAEQALTRRYGRIMPVFMTTTLASFLPLIALEPDRSSRRSLLTAGGTACYAAMLAVTLTRNVPLNNRLLELTPGDSQEFQALRARWDRLTPRGTCSTSQD